MTYQPHPNVVETARQVRSRRPIARGRIAVVVRMTIVAGIAAFGSIFADRASAADRASDRFAREIEPLLKEYCYTCHGDGAKKGGVALDGFDSDRARLHNDKLWWNVLKNIRSGIMPPAKEPKPSSEEIAALESWIKFDAIGIDPADPDPGRVTVRRLNRVEYRNTVRDLLGVDFDTTADFPPDDSGHGFDNIGEVLTISPLLLEKYLESAHAIVAAAVPKVSRVVPERKIDPKRFKRVGSEDKGGEPVLSYYEKAALKAVDTIEIEGRYRLNLEIAATEKFVDGMFDYNKCRMTIRCDGDELASREFIRQDGKKFRFAFDRDWKSGPHETTIEVEPLTPDEKRNRTLALRLTAASVEGPMDEKYWVRPADYAKFFPKDPPADPAERKAYARQLLGQFATRAFRRPVEAATKDRLATLAESIWSHQGGTFEAGVSQAMAAVLASPRFLFREEFDAANSTDRYPLIDEYSLASRLSYFFWSTAPDAELIDLASKNQLRANLDRQLARLLSDPRSGEFFRHFTGQWLQTRDIEGVPINAGAVIARDEPADPAAERRRTRFRELIRKPPEKLTEAEKKELQEFRASFPRNFRRFREFELTGDLRRAMRRETEMLFEHIIKENRSLLEILDCDYTFLNERLAKYYGIDGVSGDEMRLVKLPPNSPRGGVLTQGTILAVTSNPDRTSPVKRGLFILENLLGSPPAPPPPNIPSLEEAGKKAAGRTLTLRESMVLHRDVPSCAACHARMDPLGLALEQFNALGRFREKERGGPIDSSGELITGEKFKDVKDLKRALVDRHKREYYRCLTEKLLTYAIGRGLEATDVHSVDLIVDRLDATNGSGSELIQAIVRSAPFQKRRRSTKVEATSASNADSAKRINPNE